MRTLTIVAALLLVGCAHSYVIRSGGPEGPAVELARGASFYVGVPEDGEFEARAYEGSGRMTAEAIVDALSTRVGTARAAPAPASKEENLRAARAAGATHLIEPTILHWEERATEWSGKPDRIEVRLELVDVESGLTLDVTKLTGKSKWATFGGDHPQELLPVPLERYATALFPE